MIFYQTKNNRKGTTLCGTQADARALDRNFVQVDIPVDKTGLMAFVNGLYAKLDQADVVCDMQSEALAKDIVPAPKVNLTTKIESWFEETESGRPIDRILAKADYIEALRINQLSVERMVAALKELS